LRRGGRLRRPGDQQMSRDMHGLSKSKNPEIKRTYAIWRGMRSRCLNKKRSSYRFYGGRGIEVCERWNSFPNFRSDMGNAPVGKTLDRIDNNGNYEHGNCRWATRKEQSNNTRSNVHLTVQGRTQTIMQWSEEKGIEWSTIFYRLARGWSAERAVMQPLRNYT